MENNATTLSNQIAFLEIASLKGAAKKTMKLADSNGDSCSKSSLF